MNDTYECEVVITRKPEPELPPPFDCVICERTIVADRWSVDRHVPPLCFGCEIYQGHQVRIPGMTRGDHRMLQRLTSITGALQRAATWEPKYGRVRSI